MSPSTIFLKKVGASDPASGCRGDNTLIGRDSISTVCQDSSSSSSTFATGRWIIGVGVVGIASDLTARIDAALYYAMHDVVGETINITFIEACEALFAADLPGRIHAMTDVTNGDVRDFTPRFRESAYTPIKKLVGEAAPDDYERMCAAVDPAAAEAAEKRDRVVARVRGA